MLAALALMPLLAAAMRGRGSAVHRLAPWLVAAAGALLVASAAPAPLPVPTDRPIEVAGDGYVGSATCRKCHPGEHHSWSRSFHHTMTQPATRATLVPRFEHLELDCFGERIALRWRGDSLWVALTEPQAGGAVAGVVERQVVQLTGSHHAQVLWYRTGNQRELGAVPMIYRIHEQRWLPIAAAFLMPPAAHAAPSHGTWNRNCSGCHTTHVQPRVDIGRIDTHVAEFGIACEACHGPGAGHVAANHSPLRRYRLRRDPDGDPTIVEPSRLAAARSVEVCGQCHSASVVRQQHAAHWREHGSPFRPGQVLDDSQLVLSPEHRTAAELRSALQADPQFLEHKFWPDGDARVTGRELHGVQRSPCFQRGDGARTMTCLSCHQLHRQRDDPRPARQWADDQLRPELAAADAGGNAACLQCHPKFAEAAALVRHTHHAAASPGSACLDCHMPHTSYGLLKAVRSHLVSSPDVGVELRTGRPNACNLCHLDQPLVWTAAHLQQWFGQPVPALDDEQRTIAAGPLWLLRGDAAVRALAAWHASRPAARAATGSDWQQPFLGQLLMDPYYAVRIVSRRALGELGAGGALLAGYDELGDAAAAAPFVQRLQQQWTASGRQSPPRPALLLGDEGLDWPLFRQLLARRDDRPVFLAE